MVNTNKILTVSYGTFSCTLEGFDDSFGTMKAIAEYFRDLAADDRYFGAEPPTPDAEMLARIAEREISRRVEAHLEANNIVLRADPGSALPAAPREDEQEAAKAAEAETAPATATAVAAVASDAAIEDTAEEAEAAEAEAPAEEEALAEEDAPAEEIAEAPVEEPVAEAPVAEPEFEAPAAPAPRQAADPESVAAKLQRIRAVVSQEAAPADPAFSEDEHAEEFLADTHEDIEAALAADDEAEAARAEWEAGFEDEEEDGDDGVHALLDRFGGAGADVIDEDAVAETAEEEEDENVAEAPAADEFFELTEEDAPAAEAIVDEEDIEPEAEAAIATEDSFEDAYEEDAEDIEDLAATEEAPEPLRARVIKMKRSDFEAAIAAGEFEEEIDEPATGLSDEDEADLMRELAAVEAEFAAGDEAGDLAEAFEEDEDDEDENAFAAFDEPDEPAETEDTIAAFLADNNDEDEDEETPLSAFGMEEDDEDEDEEASFENIDEIDDDFEDAPRSAQPSPFGEDADSEMGRMFAMADSQMDEEAGKGRRNAIAHLRAAVAAAKAEEGAGGILKGHGPDTEVYRDDLDAVVRPRRPEAPAGSHTRRPAAQRPAPLKLVAEQRVDLDDANAAAPIRPRRVVTTPLDMGHDLTVDGDFAEYAESVGAHSLPELLEAAAAYLSFVEGREQFSRPQLMTHVRQVETEEFSREDGLRSFGQLLREGKIEKLEGGRFKASKSISYRPDKRYAGE